MSDAFDPYYTWLGIPPEEQPADHYRLLGVRRFEGNLDVIENAADQRMSHLRTFQTGKRASHSQKLLNELSAAKVALLNPERKATYDADLRGKLASAAAAAPPAAPPKPPPAAPPLPAASAGIDPAAPLPALPMGRPKSAFAAAAASLDGRPAEGAGPAGPAPHVTPDRPSVLHKRRGAPTLVLALAGLAVLGALCAAGGVAAYFLAAGGDEPVVEGPGGDPPAPPDPSPPQPGPQPGPPRPQPPRTAAGPASPYAYRLTGNQSLETSGLASAASLDRPFTAEMWVRWRVNPAGQFLMGTKPVSAFAPQEDKLGGWGLQLMQMSPELPTQVMLIYHDAAGGVATTRRPSLPSGGAWRHVALCRSSSEVTVYVDGSAVIEERLTTPPAPRRTTSLYLGSPQSPEGAGGGLYRDVAAFRLSSGVRYPGPFTPPAAFDKDAETLCLLDFSRPQQGEVRDLSGQNHPAQMQGGGAWVATGTDPGTSPPTGGPPAAGQPTLALRFDGTSRAEVINSRGLVSLDQPFTLELWAAPEAAGGEQILACCFDPPAEGATEAPGWSWGLQDGRMTFRPSAQAATASQGLPAAPGPWRHFALVGTGDRFLFFADGKLFGAVNADRAAIEAVQAPISLGGSPEGAPRGFRGWIGALRLSPTARYQADFAPPRDLAGDAGASVAWDLWERATSHIRDLANTTPTGNATQWGRVTGASWTAAPPRDGAPGGAASGEVDLLAKIELPRDLATGSAGLNGAVLTLEQNGDRCLVAAPFRPAVDEYVLEAEVTRVSGADALFLMFFSGQKSGRACVMLDAFPTRGPLAAVDGVEGDHAFQPDYLAQHPTAGRPGALFPAGVKRKVALAVRKTGVQVDVDGQRVIDWQGDPTTLAVNDANEVPNPNALAVGAWDAGFRISRLSYRPLGASSGPPPPAASGEELDLLARIDPAALPQGKVTLADGVLTTTKNNPGVFAPIPFTPPDREYELEFDFTLVDGHDSVLITFFVGDGQRRATFQVDGYASHNWNVDGRFLRGQSTLEMLPGQIGLDPSYLDRNPTLGVKGRLLTPGKPATARVVVQRDRIQAWVDGREVVNYTGAQDRFSPNPFVMNELNRLRAEQMAIGSWDSGYRITRLVYRPLGGGAAPPTEPPLAALPEGAVDLLSLVDLQRHPTRGRVTQVGRGYEFSGAGDELIEIPHSPPPEYDLEAEVTALDPADAIVFSLLAGDDPRRCAVSFQADVSGGGFNGVQLLDGMPGEAARYRDRAPEAFSSGLPFRADQRYTLRIEVRRDGLSGSLDGRPMFAWSGDLRRLGSWPPWLPRDRSHLAVYSKNSRYRIERLTLLPPGGAGGGTDPFLPTPPLAQRAPVPESAALEQARTEARSVFQAEFTAAKTGPEKLALAQQLADTAREAGTDPATQYALLDEARLLAADAGQAAVATKFADDLGAAFEIEPAQLKGETLQRTVPNLRTTEDQRQFAALAYRYLDEALASGLISLASDVATAGLNAAAKANDKDLRKLLYDRRDELADLKAKADLAEVARQRLQTDPDNPKANEALGRFLCFVQGKWDEGLPHLAKAEAAPLKDAAAKDLAPPADAAAQAAAGDAWYDLAQPASGREQLGLLERARHWYRQAQTGASSLTKLRIDQRLDEIDQKLAATAAPAAPAASLPDGLPETHAGLIGRLTSRNRDVGLLVRHQPGGLIRAADVEAKLDELGHSTRFYKLDLVGLIHAPRDLEATIRVAGGSSAGGVLRLYVDGKEVAEVGDDTSKDETLQLPLTRGDHLLKWELGDMNIGDCVLEIKDKLTGLPLVVYYSRPMLAAAASAAPTQAQAEFPAP